MVSDQISLKSFCSAKEGRRNPGSLDTQTGGPTCIQFSSKKERRMSDLMTEQTKRL